MDCCVLCMIALANAYRFSPLQAGIGGFEMLQVRQDGRCHFIYSRRCQTALCVCVNTHAQSGHRRTMTFRLIIMCVCSHKVGLLTYIKCPALKTPETAWHLDSQGQLYSALHTNRVQQGTEVCRQTQCMRAALDSQFSPNLSLAHGRRSAYRNQQCVRSACRTVRCNTASSTASRKRQSGTHKIQTPGQWRCLRQETHPNICRRL